MKPELMPFIPSTAIGLAGLLIFYAYRYRTNKDNKTIEAINSLKLSDRSKATDAFLNKLGVSIDTSKLSARQVSDVLREASNAEIIKFKITSITLIIVSFLYTTGIVATHIVSVKPAETIITETPNNNSSNARTDSIKKESRSKIYHVTGQVTDVSGTGLHKVYVAISKADRHCITNEYGFFDIPINDSIKSFRLYASKDGYQAKDKLIELPTENLVIELSKK